MLINPKMFLCGQKKNNEDDTLTFDVILGKDNVY